MGVRPSPCQAMEEVLFAGFLVDATDELGDIAPQVLNPYYVVSCSQGEAREVDGFQQDVISYPI